jgi:isocitrate dehydrogenase
LGTLRDRSPWLGAPDASAFAETPWLVWISTVKAGHITQDLSTLIGPNQPWLNRQDVLAKLNENLKMMMT